MQTASYVVQLVSCDDVPPFKHFKRALMPLSTAEAGCSPALLNEPTSMRLLVQTTPLLRLHCGTREMWHMSKLVLGRHRTQKLMRLIDVQWKLRERLARSPC